METRTIRNVDEETWRNFKLLAVKLGTNMAILLRTMVKEFEKNNIEFWDQLLHGERLLSESEAQDMMEISERVRKERGFRE